MFELSSFNKRFDDHFDIWSGCISKALQGRHDNRRQHVVQSIPPLLAQPECWGLKVRSVWLLLEYISDDLLGYSASHLLDEDSRHVCLSPSCEWSHGCILPVSLQQARGEVRRMRPDMHLVVQRYVQPWTEQFQVGLALMLNAGHLARRTTTSIEKCCVASIFVSHSWNDSFDDFATVLHHGLDPAAVVWISSFAIWQDVDQGSLQSVGVADPASEMSAFPFAVAIQRCQRVLAVHVRSSDVFSRCWVVLEAEAAHRWEKPFDIIFPEDAETCLWNAVGSSIEALDIEKCQAAKPEDTKWILEHARRVPGGIPALNDSVRMLARAALQRAEIVFAATTGNIEYFQNEDLTKLTQWTNIRGRSITHLAASHSHVEVMMTTLTRTARAHLDMEDAEGRTPLSVAAERGGLSAALALLNFNADPNRPSRVGLTPLHFASACGHLRSVAALLEAKADIDALGAFQGLGTCSPIMVAAWHGHATVVRVLGSSMADVESRNTIGGSALTAAASRGQADVVAALIGLNAAVEARETTFDRTPLMVAIQNGRISTVGLLLAAKARITAKAAEHYCMLCEWLDSAAASHIRGLLRNAPSAPAETPLWCSASEASSACGASEIDSPPGTAKSSPRPGPSPRLAPQIAPLPPKLMAEKTIPEYDLQESRMADDKKRECGESGHWLTCACSRPKEIACCSSRR